MSKNSVDSSYPFQDINKFRNRMKQSVGVNCNLILPCQANDHLLASVKSTLNPDLIATGHLSSRDTCCLLNPTKTLNIDTSEISTQTKKSTSIKQRHLSSTPLVPMDMFSESNESNTDMLIIKPKTPLKPAIPLVDQTEKFVQKLNLQNFETKKHGMQMKHSRHGKMTEKVKRLENELELVKSSWDREVRFIRYNMEILRNEIDLNVNFPNKQQIIR